MGPNIAKRRSLRCSHWTWILSVNRPDPRRATTTGTMRTQRPIEQGERYRYEFNVIQSGSYLYHSHVDLQRRTPQVTGWAQSCFFVQLSTATPESAINPTPADRKRNA